MRAPVLVAALAVCACDGVDTGRNGGNASATPESPAPAVPVAPHPAPIRAEAIPTAFHGVFDASEAACGRPSEYRLAVSARELRFHESIGSVRAVTIDGPDRIRVTADFRGEGASWTGVRRLQLSDGGDTLLVVAGDSRTSRLRCEGPPARERSTRWEAAAAGEGTSLVLADRGGSRVLTLLCPAGSGELLVNVPSFRAVGSEERMSFGSEGTVVALVADFRGDRERGGVSATGPVPDELATILDGPIAVNYGAQNAGPFAPPPRDRADVFVAGCRG